MPSIKTLDTNASSIKYVRNCKIIKQKLKLIASRFDLTTSYMHCMEIISEENLF